MKIGEFNMVEEKLRLKNLIKKSDKQLRRTGFCDPNVKDQISRSRQLIKLNEIKQYEN